MTPKHSPARSRSQPCGPSGGSAFLCGVRLSTHKRAPSPTNGPAGIRGGRPVPRLDRPLRLNQLGSASAFASYAGVGGLLRTPSATRGRFPASEESAFLRNPAAPWGAAGLRWCGFSARANGQRAARARLPNEILGGLRGRANMRLQPLTEPQELCAVLFAPV